MKVLIVDDSKIVCRGLQQMLINIADVEIVGQGKEANTGKQYLIKNGGKVL